METEFNETWKESAREPILMQSFPQNLDACKPSGSAGGGSEWVTGKEPHLGVEKVMGMNLLFTFTNKMRLDYMAEQEVKTG